jgi:hypothetical protein
MRDNRMTAQHSLVQHAFVPAGAYSILRSGWIDGRSTGHLWLQRTKRFARPGATLCAGVKCIACPVFSPAFSVLLRSPGKFKRLRARLPLAVPCDISNLNV